MSKIILFNKPFNVLCQFSDPMGRKTLADYIPIPNFYPAGRLDYHSEGLLLLTNDGRLQHQITDPRYEKTKTYWVQVEGEPTDKDLAPLKTGILLKDGLSRPAQVRRINEPINLWARTPPIRYRANIPSSWLEIILTEGKNHQIRRMTAAIGFPTLRLIRYKIGHWGLDDLSSGAWVLLK
jgi:23S rRNA pseudouridine2457 synthase